MTEHQGALDLDAIKQRAEYEALGPYTEEGDIASIAAARSDISALIAEVERLRGVLGVIAVAHQHAAGCYGNYNDPTMLTCEFSERILVLIARDALKGV